MVVELNLRLEGHFTDWAVVFSVDQGQSGVTLHVDARLGWKHGGEQTGTVRSKSKIILLRNESVFLAELTTHCVCKRYFCACMAIKVGLIKNL